MESTESHDKQHPPPAPSACSAFQVKLLQWWIFEEIAGAQWSGIWETQALHDAGTARERWTIQRRIPTNPTQEWNEVRENIPTWLLLKSARCVKLVDVYTPNEKALPQPPTSTVAEEIKS